MKRPRDFFGLFCFYEGEIKEKFFMDEHEGKLVGRKRMTTHERMGDT